jgi:hypothetical protein
MLYLPIIWGIVIYWSGKTGKHSKPVIFGLMAGIFAPLIIIFIVGTDGYEAGDVIDDTDIALYIFVLLVLVLTGIAISTLVMLHVANRKIGALSILIAIFRGHKIYLGNSYIFTEYSDGLSIDKIKPGFTGVEDSYFLNVGVGASERIEDLTQACLDEQNSCNRGERGSYHTLSFTKKDSSWTSVYYYNLKCDLYLMAGNNAFDDQYSDFIERFFGNNCS